MAPLIFECPRTRRAIDTGIQTDEYTLAAVTPVKLKLYCSHCCSTHELPIRRARLAEAWITEVLEPKTPKPVALSIAVNALRIFSLKRGLNG